MVLVGLIVASAVALAERVQPLRLRSRRFFRKFFITDLFYLLTGFIAGGSIALTYIKNTTDFVGSVSSSPRLATLSLPLWMTTIMAVLALDIGNYVAHYCLHRFSFLWEFHKVHHSSQDLDWLATFRSHIIEQILRRLLAPILLILFGFPMPAVVIAGAVFISWSIFNHANLRLNIAFLETIFITPRLHRIHHLDNEPNNNLGTVFTFWDRIRGTLDRTIYVDTCELGNGERNYPQRWMQQFFEPLISIWTSRKAPVRS